LDWLLLLFVVVFVKGTQLSGFESNFRKSFETVLKDSGSLEAIE